MPSFRRIIRRVRTKVSTVPMLYLWPAQFLKGNRVVSRRTNLVIEGFPRSGNSYAEAAIRLSQTESLLVAHHCHAAAQIVAAVKWDIPTLVIIREPLDACRSLRMYEPELFGVEDCFREYRIFYEIIEPFRERYVLASFETVTEDFNLIIDTLNKKFEINLSSLPEISTQKAKIFETIDFLSQQRGAADQFGEVYSPSRSEHEKLKRETDKKLMLKEMIDPSARLERERATSVYERLTRNVDV